MEYAGFSNASAAKQHQQQNGGWFFLPEDNSQIIWFSLSFTPSQICTHPATHGMNGHITAGLIN
jgi:hypothetical protein